MKAREEIDFSETMPGSLGTKLRETLIDDLRSLEDAGVSALTGGNLKDTAKTLVNSIISEFDRLYVVRPLLASIFGDQSAGVGGLFGSGPTHTPGSVSGGGGGFGFLGSLAGLAAGFLGGSGQAAFSQTSLGSPGFGTGLAYGNQDFGGYFADGGYLPPGHWGMTGERGPEPIFGGKTGVTVQPNTASSRTQNVHINVAMPQSGLSRQAGLQLGADIAKQLAVASRRNN